MIQMSQACNTQSVNVDSEVVFLATTALEEFWDISRPMVFLGRGCLLHSRRSFWEPLNASIMESPFDNEKTFHAASCYVREIYERLLPLLGNALNEVHGTHHSLRYWRILLGPWLMRYLPATYDRYIHIKYALKKYPDFKTIMLSERSFVVPSDTHDFYFWSMKDFYNLQIYTKILSALGKTFPHKMAQFELDKFAKQSWKRRVRDGLVKIFLGVGAKLSPSIVICNSYFSRQIEIWQLINTIGKVFPILPLEAKKYFSSCNNDFRKNLPKIEMCSSEFEKCLSVMLFSDMPICFVEGYSQVKSEAQFAYPKTPKAIFSATSWYFDEAFKQWAAASSEKGALLLGTTHGGAYGGFADFFVEDHETAIVDFYYTWGWERTDCFAKVFPMPATKLLGRKKLGASNHLHGILWVLSTFSRYLNEFTVRHDYFHIYLSWQSRFVKTLSSQSLANLRVRAYKIDEGLDVILRLNEIIPNITIDAWDVSFHASLANCRLYVCDHMSTTYTEALAANKPTILFWNTQANEIRAEAQPYYDLLRKSGILYDTPELASRAVNQIYDDVEIWWNNSDRQKAVNIFCERFARNSPDAIELWDAEFKKIAAIHN